MARAKRGDRDTPTGEVVGPFEVLSDLGVGTMGRVARARQISLNRLVALKILDSRLVRDKAQLDRFLREGRAAAALRHPNVAGLIDVGTCPTSGKHYIAFELVDGPSVEDLLQERGRLEETEALSICLGIAEAIACLEQHNLVHRDLQPSNILIADDGTPKIIDLGLAKRLDETGSVTVGAFISTPHYVAPEQAMALDQLDSRADLYGLGITLYRCVTGELPFEGDDFLSVVTQHVNEDVPDPRHIVATVSANTAQLIAGLCARNREQRYSPRGALVDLHRVLDGEAPLGPEEAAAVAAAGGMKPRSSPVRVAVVDKAKDDDAKSHLTDSKVDPAGSSADLLSSTPFKVVLTIEGKVTERTFDQPVVTIGRDPKCDLHINDKTVSRRHAELLRNGPTFALSVHQTANGTFLNDRSVSELAIVTPSDEVRIAEKFRLRVIPIAHVAAPVSAAPDPWRQAPAGFADDRHEDTSEIERAKSAAANAEPVPGPEHDEELDDFDPFEGAPAAPAARVEPAPTAPKGEDETSPHAVRPGSAPPRPASTSPRAAPGLPPPLPRREMPSSDRMRRPDVTPSVPGAARPASTPVRPAEPARPPSGRAPEIGRPPTPPAPRPASPPTEPSRRPAPSALERLPLEEEEEQAIEPYVSPPPRPKAASGGVAAVLFSRNGEDQRVEVTGSFKLGKGAECDVILKHPHAPRKAALIVRGVDGCTLFNVAPSPNTVTVNGKPVADEIALNDGDQIVVYGTMLKFEA